MPNPIIIINSKDTEALALYLMITLNQFGYDTHTFARAIDGLDPTEVVTVWPDIVNKAPVFIILYSDSLTKEKLLLEVIHAASAEKKAIFANTEPATLLPDWFPIKHINLSSDQPKFYRGLNQLIHQLNQYVSMWSVNQIGLRERSPRVN